MSAGNDREGSTTLVASTSSRNAVRRPHNVALDLRSLNSITVQQSSRYRSRENSNIECQRPTDGQTAYTFFRTQRRLDFAENGETLTNKACFEEWKAMAPDEKERFEREARENRRIANAKALAESSKAESEQEDPPHGLGSCGNGSMLQRLQEQSNRLAKATAKLPASKNRPLDETSETSKEKRHRKKDPVEEIRRPVFPQRRDAGPSCVDRTGRREEIFESIRTSAQTISVSTCHDASLSEISARLEAPTLSCDWQKQASSDGDLDDEDRLEVDMPPGTNARELMEEEVRRQISSAQVRRLIKNPN